MASRPELFLPVEAQGELRLDAPTGRSVGVVADGDVVRVDMPGWRELRAAMPGPARSRRQLVRSMARILKIYGLTLQVESGGTTVASLGRGVSANWLGRLTGLAPAHIPLSAIRFLFRR